MARVTWEVALDRSDSLCPGFLPISGEVVLQQHRGQVSCRGVEPVLQDAASWQNWQGASRASLQIQPVIPEGFGARGMWSTEIEDYPPKSKPVIHLSGQSLPVTVFLDHFHGKALPWKLSSLGCVPTPACCFPTSPFRLAFMSVLNPP